MDSITEQLEAPPRYKIYLGRAVALPFMREIMRLAMHLFIRRHRIGVVIICRDYMGRVLFLKHVYHPDIPWGLPGGWLSRNEAPRNGALRELYEETGLSADLGPAVYVSFEPEPRHVGIAFLARVGSGTLRLSSEIIEAKWCLPNEMKEPLLAFSVKALEAADAAIYSGNGLNEEEYE